MKLFPRQVFSKALTALWKVAGSAIPNQVASSVSGVASVPQSVPQYLYASTPASHSRSSLLSGRTLVIPVLPSGDPQLNPAYDPSPEISSNCPSSIIPWEKERLFDVFPPGLESNSGSLKGQFYPIAPLHLHNIFLRYRGNPLVERTVVRSAWYGKQTKSARHEYIVLLIEDLEIPGLRNYMAIDRSQGDSKGKVQSLTAVCSKTAAFDSFKVSCDGDETQLLHRSQLTPHLELERISFQDGDLLLLRDLVTLVHHISERHEKFHALDTNCYWFTGLIWECMRRLCPQAHHEINLPGRRGKIGLARIVPNPVQVRSVLRDIRSWGGRFDLQDWENLDEMPRVKLKELQV